ncbi:hypothetical protein BCR44DRAFT_93606 [Catenaria anguillulae PL171]|uniref:Uncharacterized protein n=1 Tax=Catenaria anguillulae PL171 TaxID=765915 RepID=A0A1Y2HUS6_9FUNG|nr:hypothetical protein BCR44DRAFT_93606 [Catenaria anguillulae PL171]
MSCQTDSDCGAFQGCMKDTGICVPQPCSAAFLGNTCQEKDKSKYCSQSQGICVPRIAADQPCQGNPLAVENVCQDGFSCSASGMGLGKCVASGGVNGGNNNGGGGGGGNGGGGGGGGGLFQPNRSFDNINSALGVPTNRVGDVGSTSGGTVSQVGPSSSSGGVSTAVLFGSILGALAVGVLLAVMLRRRRRFHAPRPPIPGNVPPPAAALSNSAAPPPPPYLSSVPLPMPDKPSSVEYVTLAPLPSTPSGSSEPQFPTANPQPPTASPHVPSAPQGHDSPWDSSSSLASSLPQPASRVEVRLGPGDAELALPTTPARPCVDADDDLLLPTGTVASGNLVQPDQRT